MTPPSESPRSTPTPHGTATARPPGTARARGSRRAEILRAAAALFAARGFHGVSIEDIGAAVGTSGPALYRHFTGKDALLAEMLLDISERLRATGAAVVTSADGPQEALDALLAGHVAFALGDPALITVHDRELDNVPEPARRAIRRLQRLYVEEWVTVLSELHPSCPQARLRAATHAVLGLLNSTPHSAGELPADAMTALLRTMARAALSSAAS
ncbi:SACE_7040 family transcriptional regulator [Spongiactinospora gelatinilytica]|uniref:SACE_7040 family transcriptional regulator n=1 Tax=Spongiactinospora gelatinilytica TaxID=2666298 RepID=UPI003F667AEF